MPFDTKCANARAVPEKKSGQAAEFAHKSWLLLTFARYDLAMLRKFAKFREKAVAVFRVRHHTSDNSLLRLNSKTQHLGKVSLSHRLAVM